MDNNDSGSEKKQTRRSYTAAFKLKVMAYGEKHSNREAGREYDVDEKSVRQWRKEREMLMKEPSTRKARRRSVAHWLDLEEELNKWVRAQREKKRSVSRKLMRQKAQSMAKEMNVTNFTGGPTWCYRFMKRNDLLRQSRSTGKMKKEDVLKDSESTVKNDNNLTTNTVNNVESGTTVVNSLPTECDENINDVESTSEKINTVSVKVIGNMDEQPKYFYAILNRTVENVATQTVDIETNPFYCECL